jgi:lipid A 3-O-deacylase
LSRFPRLHIPSRSVRHAWIALATLCLLANTAARADDPAFLTVGAGAFDVGKSDTAFEGRVEYRAAQRFWIFKPFGGLMATSDNAAYAYGGVLIDMFFGRRWVATGSFAPGAFHHGDGKDLGHGLEFRSQLEIAYRFDDRSRLGFALSHMSNASIGRKNPGEESLTINYSIPFNRLFSRARAR